MKLLRDPQVKKTLSHNMMRSFKSFTSVHPRGQYFRQYVLQANPFFLVELTRRPHEVGKAGLLEPVTNSEN